jgi:hypothetical protein
LNDIDFLNLLSSKALSHIKIKEIAQKTNGRAVKSSAKAYFYTFQIKFLYKRLYLLRVFQQKNKIKWKVLSFEEIEEDRKIGKIVLECSIYLLLMEKAA